VNTWRDAAADLLLGSCCAGCGAAGRGLCEVCAATVVARPRLAWPDPVPVALEGPIPVPPWTGGTYDDRLRQLIVAYKEESRYGLARPLGRLLAQVVGQLLKGVPTQGARVALVPVPSAPAAVRRRGQDHVLRLARVSAAELRHRGQDVIVEPLLRQRRAVADQSGLSAGDRSRNLEGALSVRPHFTGSVSPLLVVVDDVITTGASAAEAVTTLREAGWRPLAVATLAATARRRPSEQARLG